MSNSEQLAIVQEMISSVGRRTLTIGPRYRCQRKKEPGIYAIRLDDGRCYIGSSIDVNHRLRQHLLSLIRGSHFNKHLQRAWTKYGPFAFTMTVLEYVAREDLESRYSSMCRRDS